MSTFRMKILPIVIMLLLLPIVAITQDGDDADEQAGAAVEQSEQQDTDAENPAAEDEEAAEDTDEAEADASSGNSGGESSCITCHREMGGVHTEIVNQFEDSIHSELDFGCTDCHGGDPTTDDVFAAKSEESGFIGKPDRMSIPDLCARCHSDAELMRQYGNIRTDQLDLYRTSQHGQALYENGDTNVAICIDCHTPHHILKVNNPNSSVHKKNQSLTCGKCHSNGAIMEAYGLDHELPANYRSGQHGIQLLENDDMGAPVCSNCHGSHGAMPPGVATVENVCGTCHLATEKYFNQSRHAEIFGELGLGQCVACHDPHRLPKPTDNFLSEQAEPSCMACHSEDTEQYTMIGRMHDSITGIQDLHDEAIELVEETEHTTHMSMYDMTPQVELIRTKMLTARAMVHATDPEAMEVNLQEARDTFTVIQEFTIRLIERAKINKTIVAILAVVLVGFGLLMFVYRRMVLDIIHPWQEYRGDPDEG